MTHGAASASQGHHAGEAPGEHEVGHPGELTYIKVAIVLAVITVVEVVIYYIEWMHDAGLLVPALLLLSAIKFATVVGFFMHLKFDDRRLTYVFGGGLVVGASIVITLKVLQDHHKIDYALNFFR